LRSGVGRILDFDHPVSTADSIGLNDDVDHPAQQPFDVLAIQIAGVACPTKRYQLSS